MPMSVHTRCAHAFLHTHLGAFAKSGGSPRGSPKPIKLLSEAQQLDTSPLILSARNRREVQSWLECKSGDTACTPRDVSE